MKTKIIFTFICLMFHLTSNAQCNIKQEKTDKLTGEIGWSYAKIGITGYSWGVGMQIKKHPSLPIYKIRCGYNNVFNAGNNVISEGDSVCFKTVNGELISMYSLETKRSNLVMVGNQSNWLLEIDYFISEENLRKLANSPISLMRIYGVTQYRDVEFGDGRSVKINTAAACIIEIQ